MKYEMKAVIDEKTCEMCIGYDGIITDDPDISKRHCKHVQNKTGECRCVATPIEKEEEHGD